MFLSQLEWFGRMFGSEVSDYLAEVRPNFSNGVVFFSLTASH